MLILFIENFRFYRSDNSLGKKVFLINVYHKNSFIRLNERNGAKSVDRFQFLKNYPILEKERQNK